MILLSEPEISFCFCSSVPFSIIVLARLYIAGDRPALLAADFATSPISSTQRLNCSALRFWFCFRFANLFCIAISFNRFSVDIANSIFCHSLRFLLFPADSQMNIFSCNRSLNDFTSTLLLCQVLYTFRIYCDHQARYHPYSQR